MRCQGLYIWNTMRQLILLNGMNCIFPFETGQPKLESCDLLKQHLGFSRRTRSSHLLQALHVARIHDIVKRNMHGIPNKTYF